MTKSRRKRSAGHITRMERRGMHVGYLWGNPEGKGPLGRQCRRWVDDIKIDIRDIE
jgi:hypothetical protein